jgi:hypothetical protein
MDVDYRGQANVWETFTLPSTFSSRYVLIQITGNGIDGEVLKQWQDINATYVPEPITMVLFGLGTLMLRRRHAA